MRILHVFDHSIPLHSGYTFRSFQILQEQRALGYDTVHVTSIKHLNPTSSEEIVEDLKFFRTTQYNKLFTKLPVLNQFDVVRSLKKRLRQILKIQYPGFLVPASTRKSLICFESKFETPLLTGQC